MKVSDLEIVISEVERFTALARRLLSAKRPGYGDLPGGKDAAAVRRASLDLSMALAELRKGKWEDAKSIQ